jgi:hypothetical protein
LALLEPGLNAAADFFEQTGKRGKAFAQPGLMVSQIQAVQMINL